MQHFRNSLSEMYQNVTLKCRRKMHRFSREVMFTENLFVNTDLCAINVF